MLDSKKEIIVLETTKRSPFHLLSGIFSKKKASIIENDKISKPPEPHRDRAQCSTLPSVKQKVDLETLHLSRQDNPYLKQLERLSVPEETLISCADFQGDWLLDSDLHQHLVRSPPPQFPQNITHFVYSQANSPKRQINHTAENLESPAKQCKKAKSLNPIQPKKEMDPGIREVLEYQKSQLIADSICHWNAGLKH